MIKYINNSKLIINKLINLINMPIKINFKKIIVSNKKIIKLILKIEIIFNHQIIRIKFKVK